MGAGKEKGLILVATVEKKKSKTAQKYIFFKRDS